MTNAIYSRWTSALLAVVAVLLLAACGGGSGDGGTPLEDGAIQVLNNTGTDLADVEVWSGGAKIAEIGGGLVLGGSWTFSGLPPGVYDVLGIPGGGGFQVVLSYFDNIVTSGQTTNLTLTP